MLAQIELYTNRKDYPIGVYILPKRLDEKVARLQLSKLGAMLTEMTEEQARYVGLPKDGPYKSDHYRYWVAMRIAAMGAGGGGLLRRPAATGGARSRSSRAANTSRR